MDKLRAMQVFIEVAEKGSLTQAGDALHMSRAMVSRHLKSLETWLDARLLNRSTRHVSLTSVGEEALKHCRELVEQSDALQNLTRGQRQQPRGKLRVAASSAFAQTHLVELFAEFLQRNPQTQLELQILERAVNLVEERIDLALRITNQLDPSLVARKLGNCHSLICATPSYLEHHPAPTVPEALTQHRCITHAYFGQSHYHLKKNNKPCAIPIQSIFQCNETNVMLKAVQQHLGIALLPRFLVAKLIEEGQLIHLLPDYTPEVLGIYAIYLSRHHQPLLLSALLDFLGERLGQAPIFQ